MEYITVFGKTVYSRTERNGVNKTKIDPIQTNNIFLRIFGFDVSFEKCTTNRCNGGQPEVDEMVTKNTKVNYYHIK